MVQRQIYLTFDLISSELDSSKQVGTVATKEGESCQMFQIHLFGKFHR